MNQPLVWRASEAHRDNIVSFTSAGEALVRFGEETLTIPVNHQYDLTQAAIFGLNERLTLAATSPVLESGKTLREEFNSEWEAYSQALTELDGHLFNYGYYAFYPHKGDLVRFCPPFWHHVAAVASSSKLLADPTGRLSWREIRTIFEQTVIGVAGCSVGSSVVHAAVLDLRPAQLKIADKSAYKLENINRVRLSYDEMVKNQAERASLFDLALRNKAEVVAEQLYAIDPFLKVYVYNNGIQPDTVNDFFAGTDSEPPIDIIVEEVDDPRTKLMLREEARRRGVPLVMVTDIGSAVQLDILRYDKDKQLPLSYGVTDAELYAKMEAVYIEAGNRRVFFEFVDALIGPEYRQRELAAIIEEKCEIPTSTIIPQLGSTVGMAGAIAAEAIARLRLGYDYPPRAIINKHDFSVTVSR